MEMLSLENSWTQICCLTVIGKQPIHSEPNKEGLGLSLPLHLSYLANNDSSSVVNWRFAGRQLLATAGSPTVKFYLLLANTDSAKKILTKKFDSRKLSPF